MKRPFYFPVDDDGEFYEQVERVQAWALETIVLCGGTYAITADRVKRGDDYQLRGIKVLFDSFAPAERVQEEEPEPEFAEAA